MAEDEHGDHGTQKWDIWAGWFEPWLWYCVDILFVYIPGDLFEMFWRHTWTYAFKEFNPEGFPRRH